MNTEPGKVHTTEVYSEACGESFEIQYYLPKNYSDSNQYNVIVTFDSQDFFRYGQIERLYERLRKKEEIERAIIVGIPYPNVEWRNHYFHPNGEHHENMVTFVGRELIQWIDSTFPTLQMAHSRVLMGESLAGSFAYSVALSYPATFPQALAFSPYIDEDFIQRFRNQPNLMQLDLYHTIGLEEADFTTVMGNEADFLTPNRELHELLEDEPFEYEYRELEGGHVWKTWKPELENILKHYLQ